MPKPHGAALAVAALFSGCAVTQSPSGPQPVAPLAVKVDVLGGGCTGALTLATQVSNLSATPIRLSGLTLSYATDDARCTSHRAPIDGVLAESLAPGQALVVHRLDPKGTLCEAPTGAFGCEWKVTADLSSDAGVASGSTTFVGSGPGRGWSPDDPRAEIVTPRAGAVLSGVVPVQPRWMDGCGAVNSSRMLVFLFRGSQVVASSPPLDLDSWRLDTTSYPNGEYALGTMQNRCGVLGPLAPVSIRN